MKISITWFSANQLTQITAYVLRFFSLTTLVSFRNVARPTVIHKFIKWHCKLLTGSPAFYSITNHYWAHCTWWVFSSWSFHVLRISFYIKVQDYKTHVKSSNFGTWYKISFKQWVHQRGIVTWAVLDVVVNVGINSLLIPNRHTLVMVTFLVVVSESEYNAIDILITCTSTFTLARHHSFINVTKFEIPPGNGQCKMTQTV